MKSHIAAIAQSSNPASAAACQTTATRRCGENMAAYISAAWRAYRWRHKSGLEITLSGACIGMALAWQHNTTSAVSEKQRRMKSIF